MSENHGIHNVDIIYMIIKKDHPSKVLITNFYQIWYISTSRRVVPIDKTLIAVNQPLAGELYYR